MNVSGKTGLARIAGTLSDGTAFTASTTVLGDGTVPIWSPLYGRTGVLTGDLLINPGLSGNPVSAQLFWTKPANVPRSPDSSGFQNVFLTAENGSGLYNPASIVLPPPPGNLQLFFNEGNWSANPARLVGGNFSQLFTVANGRISPLAPNPNNVSASWNIRSGRVSGSFNNPFTPGVPSTNRLARFQAIILTNGTLGIRGNFILPNMAIRPTYYLGGRVRN